MTNGFELINVPSGLWGYDILTKILIIFETFSDIVMKKPEPSKWFAGKVRGAPEE